MQHRKIAFIGAGNMTRSIIGGMVKSGYPANLIFASNPSLPKLEALKQECGIHITQDNLDAIRQAEVVVLAVKPQLMEQVCQHLQQADMSGKLFVSIAAGIKVARLQQMLGGQYSVVRTMPNTPSALALGMTGLYADSQVGEQDRDFATALMGQIGETLWVAEEEMINGVIASAGSSPAYFFLFLEAMQEEAIKMGFERTDARLLVQQAMLGSAQMVCQNPQLELAELRAQVTSKGGTTAKAVEHFEQQGLRQLVSGAMGAAVTRAKQMSEEF
ncbi:pyrroline-5-carboxylate reductase [Aliiglaciecola sp. CAU 1673]|uniref:pyrroline-5-carboxylate reductase n=1 Tax=Aliiglaciecola sp. CAU 1673 TaxID=3032595 RepID=UPI0023DA457F|nr:pyrroline-5-carboxylate reductase [Aliiglaciecola sp. CAU 1673]MDF2179500.1 pyrroline-5-carboxylate reductase [Aliiglaciecola sp. CAU 1673]